MVDRRAENIVLYTAQDEVVLATLKKDGVCYAKREYVERKYEESAAAFLVAYEWFAKAAAALVERPEPAELPYWAFADADYASCADYVLTLEVPRAEVVLFDMFDWTTILQLNYLGLDAADEAAFAAEMAACGLTGYQVMTNRFYPEWQDRIYDSWQRLFRRHDDLRAGAPADGSVVVQAALWQIKAAWVRHVRAC